MDDVLGYQKLRRAPPVAGEVLAVDGGFQGARFTVRHQAGWADLIAGV